MILRKRRKVKAQSWVLSHSRLSELISAWHTILQWHRETNQTKDNNSGINNWITPSQTETPNPSRNVPKHHKEHCSDARHAGKWRPCCQWNVFSCLNSISLLWWSWWNYFENLSCCYALHSHTQTLRFLYFCMQRILTMVQVQNKDHFFLLHHITYLGGKRLVSTAMAKQS